MCFPFALDSYVPTMSLHVPGRFFFLVMTTYDVPIDEEELYLVSTLVVVVVVAHRGEYI